MAEMAAALTTAAEFLAWEDRQAERFERLRGVVTMMTGGTLDHVEICGNLAFALRQALDRPECRVYQSDLKVVVPDGSVLYPDVSVRCGPREGKATAVDDPLLVAEVLSESTAARDLHRKCWAYQSIPALRHLLLIDQDEAVVECVGRDEDEESWCSSVLRGLDTPLALPALGLTLRLGDLYRGVLDGA